MKFLLLYFLEKITNFILDKIFNDYVCTKFGSYKFVNKMFILTNNFSLLLTKLRFMHIHK
jgi:hypothetical protein